MLPATGPSGDGCQPFPDGALQRPGRAGQLGMALCHRPLPADERFVRRNPGAQLQAIGRHVAIHEREERGPASYLISPR